MEGRLGPVPNGCPQAKGGTEHNPLYFQVGPQWWHSPVTLQPHGDGGLLEGLDYGHLAGFWKVLVNPASSPGFTSAPSVI